MKHEHISAHWFRLTAAQLHEYKATKLVFKHHRIWDYSSLISLTEFLYNMIFDRVQFNNFGRIITRQQCSAALAVQTQVEHPSRLPQAVMLLEWWQHVSEGAPQRVHVSSLKERPTDFTIQLKLITSLHRIATSAAKQLSVYFPDSDKFQSRLGCLAFKFIYDFDAFCNYPICPFLNCITSNLGKKRTIAIACKSNTNHCNIIDSL